MSAQALKELLKRCKEAISSGRFPNAIEAANDALEVDEENYQATLLLGKAQHLNKDDTAACAAYDKAIKLEPTQPLAYIGLLQACNVRSNGKKYLATLVEVLKLLCSQDQQTKANDTYCKSERVIYAHGTPETQLEFTKLQIPGSPLFELMEAVMPKPAFTFEKLVKMEEEQEKKALNKALADANFTITGKKKRTPQQVRYDFYSKSNLPFLYQELINWTNNDELRTETEKKLLKARADLLASAPQGKEKELLHMEVSDMVDGAVVVKSRDSLAWDLYLEWLDPRDLSDLPSETVNEYLDFFPETGLHKILSGYVYSDISSIVRTKKKEKKEEEGDEGTEDKSTEDKDDTKEDSKDAKDTKTKPKSKDAKKDSKDDSKEDPKEDEDLERLEENVNDDEVLSEDITTYLAEGLKQDPKSILGHRISAQYYFHHKEYAQAIRMCLAGIETANTYHNTWLSHVKNALRHFNIILGTCYIFYQAPKNFDNALEIFNGVLAEEPKNVAGLVGKGLILVEKKQWSEARTLLQEVVDKNPDNSQALFELSWCCVLMGDYEQGRKGLQHVIELVTGSDSVSRDLRAQCYWRIGQSYEKEGCDDTEVIFQAYLKSLTENPNFAPSYTALGLLYADSVGDQKRASKCFYKALELSALEIKAAERLAIEFSDKADWDAVEVIANRVIGVMKDKVAWPYRALGISYLNKNDFGKAIVNFQWVLRVDSTDVNAWTGLGEAYKKAGRLTSALKALERANDLIKKQDDDSENQLDRWIPGYLAAVSHTLLAEYSDALEILSGISEKHPHEVIVLRAQQMTLNDAATASITDGLYVEAANYAIKALESCAVSVAHNHLTQDLWKSVGDACAVFLRVESQVDQFPIELAKKIFSGMSADKVREFNNFAERNFSFDSNHALLVQIGEHDGQPLDGADLEYPTPASLEAIKVLYLTAFKYSLLCARPDPSTQAAGWYNLGLAELGLALRARDKNDENLNLAASQCLKRALHIEHKNADIWNAFGVASVRLNVRVAQHCFIRALTLNNRAPQIWANLGALYLGQGDLELAKEAFSLTQTMDPEFVEAWQGLGIIASVTGDEKKARANFEQSFLVSKGVQDLAKLLYGLSVFEKVTGTGSREVAVENATLALDKLLKAKPNSKLGLLLRGSLLEFQGDYEEAEVQITHLCNALEELYEELESEQDLEAFAKAKSQLARLALGMHDFEAAIQHAEFALDVAQERPSLSKTRLSAHITCGLAYFFISQFDQSISCFQQALEESDEDQEIVVLLVQVLWAKGGEARDVARDQLYDSVEHKGSNLKIALVLGAIGLVEENTDLQDAALDELNGLSLDLKLKDSGNKLEWVTSLLAKSLTGSDFEAALPWRRSAFVNHSEYKVWSHVDKKIALQVANQNALNRASFDYTELSDALVDMGTLECAQRALFLRPSSVNAWKTLAGCV
ncbi:Superkiller protein 3 [Yarrowia sp. B02]|nr:Superkiller protein 3 [Yarrowia sp. B02]